MGGERVSDEWRGGKDDGRGEGQDEWRMGKGYAKVDMMGWDGMGWEGRY